MAIFGETPPKGYGRRAAAGLGLKVAAGFAAALAGCLMPGCLDQDPGDRGANHSLVEIGELSLEQGETLEERGMTRDANVSYRKALWAFRYHEKLTGEQPFLMEEAVSGIDRTAGPGGR